MQNIKISVYDKFTHLLLVIAGDWTHIYLLLEKITEQDKWINRFHDFYLIFNGYFPLQEKIEQRLTDNIFYV